MIKIITEEHINEIREWFEKQTGTALPREVLSTLGYVYSNDLHNVAAIFLYPTEHSRVCFLGWPVANPQSTREERNKALTAVIKAAETYATAKGYLFMNTYASRKSVENRFRKMGYVDGDKNVLQMFRYLGG